MTNNSVEVVQLLPCPFCGAMPSLHGFHAPEFWVMCDTIGCKAQTEAFGSKEKAVKVWNTRINSEKALAERVREACANVAERLLFHPHPDLNDEENAWNDAVCRIATAIRSLDLYRDA